MCHAENTQSCRRSVADCFLFGRWGGGGSAKVVLLKDCLSSGNTLTGQCYADLLTKLRKSVVRKQATACAHLLQYNNPLIKDGLNWSDSGQKFEYSSTSTLFSGFHFRIHFLFPKFKKKQHKRNHFNSEEEVMLASGNLFSSEYWVFYSQGCFQGSQRWQRCVNSERGYIVKE